MPLPDTTLNAGRTLVWTRENNRELGNGNWEDAYEQNSSMGQTQ